MQRNTQKTGRSFEMRPVFRTVFIPCSRSIYVGDKKKTRKLSFRVFGAPRQSKSEPDFCSVSAS